ncbi:MAG: helix-turn-helix transcriptional regulator, partial [Catenulispora sp.]|nr:helix-turn-helix transcriptional regulator [Catenulispora sp.]
ATATPTLTADAAPPRRPAIEPVTGKAAIQAVFEDLAYGAKVCVDRLTPTPRVSETAAAQSAALDATLLQRGIRMRSLYLDAIHDDPPSADYARALQTAGAHVRTSPALPQCLFVVDRRVALVPLDPALHGCGAAVVRAPGVVAALVGLFDAVWHDAAPLDIGRDIGLSNTERSLLRLLAEGASDERAAKKLGVSLRTVRRIMADLMHRLDASSRFEAGIKAAKRGWL